MMKTHLSTQKEYNFDLRSLEKTLEILDRNPNANEKILAFRRECRKNLGLEATCIGMCEAGDFLASAASMLSDSTSQYINGIGFLSGIVTGFGYAGWHTTRDAKRHSKKLSFYEMASIVVAIESGCILGATGVTYLFGNIASQFPRISWENFSIRGLSLIPAFLIGTPIMSALTLRKKDEVSRFVSQRETLPEIGNYLESRKLPHEIDLRENSLTLNGRGSFLEIKEKKLPKSYCNDFDQQNNSLYIVRSSLVRYLPEEKEKLGQFVEEAFNIVGRDIYPVEDICSHEDAHTH